MRCSQCGNTKFLESGIPMGSVEGGVYFSSDIKVYVCENCGHYEMFSSLKRIKIYKKMLEFIENFNNDINELKSKLKLQEDYTANVKSQIKSIKMQIKQLGIDITIRQQQDFEAQIQKLQTEIENKELEKRQIEEKMSKIQIDIEYIQKAQEHLLTTDVESFIYQYAYTFGAYGRRIKREDFMALICDCEEE